MPFDEIKFKEISIYVCIRVQISHDPQHYFVEYNYGIHLYFPGFQNERIYMF